MTDVDDRPRQTRDPRLREALGWHIRLSEDPEDRQAQEEFAVWLAQTADHAAAWAHACRTMGLLEISKSVAFLPLDVPDKVGRRRWLWPVVSTGIAAALVLALMPVALLHWQADYVAPIGQEKRIELKDGSVVRLAPGSAIKIAYQADRRDIRLLSGEADFEVVHNARRPFTVSAKSALVAVLGTGFDVRVGVAGADIAVRHGRVKVEQVTGAFSGILTDGQWVRLAANGRSTEGRTAPANVGGWSGERLIALGQPLDEALADLRRSYRGVIVLTDHRLGQRIVTGAYDLRDPAKAADTMVGPLGAQVRHITPWIMVISPAASA